MLLNTSKFLNRGMECIKDVIKVSCAPLIDYYIYSNPLPFNCKNHQFDPWGNGTISSPNAIKLSKNTSNAQVQYMKLVKYIHGIPLITNSLDNHPFIRNHHQCIGSQQGSGEMALLFQ